MKTRALHTFCDDAWEKSIIPELIDYIHIPNKSPMFDADWQQHGYMDAVVEQFVDWCQRYAMRICSWKFCACRNEHR